jgi:hypothetical protein
MATTGRSVRHRSIFSGDPYRLLSSEEMSIDAIPDDCSWQSGIHTNRTARRALGACRLRRACKL